MHEMLKTFTGPDPLPRRLLAVLVVLALVQAYWHFAA